MLLRNFKACYQNVNAVKNLFSVIYYSKKVPQGGKFGRWSEYNIRLTPEQYKRKFKQCPKLSRKQFRWKKLFSKPVPKCEMVTAGDEYLRARQSLKLRVKDVVNFVEAESRSIVNNIESYLEKSQVTHAAQLEKLFEKTTQKLDKLISLDVTYNCWMRKETLLLNDEMRRSFDALERALALNAKHLGTMLKSLQSDVSSCTMRAEESIVACREHGVPSELTECVKKRLNEATKMVDQMNEEARVKLAEIARFREMIVRAHERTAEEVVEVNRKKAVELSKYLGRCISKVKKSNKWWK